MRSKLEYQAVGLDVYEKKKNIFFNHITKKWGSFIHYTSLPNVLITGHQGFLTNEALEVARTIGILMHGHVASLKTNLNNSFQIIIQTPHVI
jgi:lactate dehydrogenase-like 2-hydroxyacid dehydrogenase